MLECAHVPLISLSAKEDKEGVDGAESEYVGTRYESCSRTLYLRGGGRRGGGETPVEPPTNDGPPRSK